MFKKQLALLILTTAVIGAGCGVSRPAPMPAPKGIRTTRTHKMTPHHKSPMHKMRMPTKPMHKMPAHKKPMHKMPTR